jgi:hypothetical protein
MRLWMPRTATRALIDGIAMEGIVRVDDPIGADYALIERHVERLHEGRIEYAWMRPLVRNEDRRIADYRREPRGSPASRLCVTSIEAASHSHLARAESPPNTRTYRRTPARKDERARPQWHRHRRRDLQHRFARIAAAPRGDHTTPYYAFIIDSHGKSFLAFLSGSVEPFSSAIRSARNSPRRRKRVRDHRALRHDTYVLLSTDEPLPNPSILEWEEALNAPDGQPLVVERVMFESVPP